METLLKDAGAVEVKPMIGSTLAMIRLRILSFVFLSVVVSYHFGLSEVKTAPGIRGAGICTIRYHPITIDPTKTF